VRSVADLGMRTLWQYTYVRPAFWKPISQEMLPVGD